ncbi:ROK family protein [Methylophilus sp. 5]|uniref:ROK family protein n=1 Tax=Methylophilus sp. 5 TaxID=1112274 RepID=UPI00048ECA18|nr:ROK family protein [Methylophilus sp. 5]
MPEASAVYRLGLDVGGTNLRLGVFADLALVEETRFQANYSAICKQYPPAQAWQTILQVTAEAIQPLLKKYAEITAIGIGFPGFIDPNTGVLAQSPNLPGLREVNLGHDLSGLLGVHVRVENDANAAAYGEFCQLGQPAGGLLYVGLGTGVGAGLVVNGQVWAGHHGYALEAGHIIVVPDGRLCGCGNEGCVEQYASATGISQAYAALTGQTRTARDIAQAADDGDIDAQAVYVDAGSKLAQMLASVLKVVDVENVLIGGGVAAAWSLMSAAFHQRLEHDLIPVLRGKIKLHITGSGDVAGMLGAALLAA